MEIVNIISQHRRDFRALYQCGYCGFEMEGAGYDDKNFHENVIPNMKCPKCGKVEGATYEPRETKYSEDTVI